MKIAFVSAHYSPFIGGVESHIVHLASRMAARGHEVTVLTHREPHADSRAHEMLNGVTVHRFAVPIPSQNYAISPQMLRFLARHSQSVDVTHGHGYHAVPALAAALFKQGPLIFTPHYHGTGHSLFRKLLHPPYRVLGRQIFGRADRTIAVSPPEAELILGHFPKTRPRLVVIPNGVDQEKLSDAHPFPGEQTVILNAGRIESYKQVDKAILAMSHLPDDFVLRVTGDGGARAENERLVRDRGLSDRVEFLGRVSDEDLYRWFKTAKVYVSMSSNEAMPVTFIESLAAGAAVVASDIPAHRDLVKKTGGSITLLPLDADPETVAQAVLGRSRGPVRKPAVDTWDDVVTRTLELYDEVRDN